MTFSLVDVTQGLTENDSEFLLKLQNFNTSYCVSFSPLIIVLHSGLFEYNLYPLILPILYFSSDSLSWCLQKLTKDPQVKWSKPCSRSMNFVRHIYLLHYLRFSLSGMSHHILQLIHAISSLYLLVIHYFSSMCAVNDQLLWSIFFSSPVPLQVLGLPS